MTFAREFLCSNCQHKEICKHMQEANRVEVRIGEISPSLPLQVVMKCGFFLERQEELTVKN